MKGPSMTNVIIKWLHLSFRNMEITGDEPNLLQVMMTRKITEQ